MYSIALYQGKLACQSMVPQGALRLEERRVAGYPADRMVLRRGAPCKPIVRPANFPA